jgi:branched-chain amino acid transport system ATP-binding protein
VEGIQVVYNQAILAVGSVSLQVDEGQIVALLGANGAGKSTTLKAIAGLVAAERGCLQQGRIVYAGQDVSHTAPHELVQRGLVQVLEGRHCFAHLSVEENLLTGACAQAQPRCLAAGPHLPVFPAAEERRRSQAGYTSGGEQQMVAIGRALMAAPRLVLLDEPSMGLAPKIVEEFSRYCRR